MSRRAVKVSDLGEFGLIDRLTAVFDEAFEAGRSQAGEPDGRLRLLLGVGDDAAAWDGPAGTTVFTCDAMVAGSHFDLNHDLPEEIGWRAAVSCQSDIAAMGYRPTYSTVTLGLTGDEPVEVVDAIYRGMAQACSRFGGRVVGGDVVRAPIVFLSVAMVGTDAAPVTEPPTRPMVRSAATVGDVIAVTGPLGGSAGGLRVLLAEGQAPARSEASETLVAAHRRPLPRIETGIWLAAHGVACAVDVSDGLVADLGRVCAAGEVGAALHMEKLPVEPALRTVFPDDWADLALGGGEGYQLIFTAPGELVERARGFDPSIVVIGEVVEGPAKVTVVDEDGATYEPASSGFDHFPKNMTTAF